MTGVASRTASDLRRTRELVSIETTRLGDRQAQIKVRGNLDVSTAAALWAVLQSHLAAGRRFLRLDLSALSFLDTAAVAAIVEVHHEALYRRGTLVLVGVNERVARVLALTGVGETLFVAGPRSDADFAPAIPVENEGQAALPGSWPTSPTPSG